MPHIGANVEIPNVPLHTLLWKKCKEREDDGICKDVVVDNSCNGKSMTYMELHDKSRKCAAFLRQHGVKTGDVVGLATRNSANYLVAMVGIFGCGGIATACNPKAKEGEIIRAFAVTLPTLVFVDEESVETMTKVQKRLPSIKELFVIGDARDFVTLDRILGDSYDLSVLDNISIDPATHTASIPYTSGTTGLPKGVEVTHRNLVAMCIAMNACHVMHEESCLYSSRPMYHALGYGIALISILVGCKLVIDKPTVDVKTVLRAVEYYKITHMCTAPPDLIHLVNSAVFGYYDSSSLRSVMVSGASAAPAVIIRFEEQFKAKVIPAYGASEANFISIGCDGGKLGSVGSACPTVEIKILNVTNNVECSANEDGEISVRGPQVMKGYLMSETTGVAQVSKLDKQGWVRTGDLGHFDEEGNLYIVDRLKELIKYKGVQVSPSELENLLLTHPKVADAGVIGMPDPIDGELPRAYVVKRDQSLTECEIQAFVTENLSEHKQLRGGVTFIAAIPKSASGKILRQKIRKLAGL